MTISRRRFLEAAGFVFTLAAVPGCSPTPTEIALPMVDPPEGMIPGRTKTYATTCNGCPAGCGILASVRDGRPLKMEGMPEHPISKGGLCAIGQALPLGLYDSHRLQHPLQKGEKTDWNTVDEAVIKSLKQVSSENRAIRLVTPTITSPTLKAAIDQFLKQFTDAKQITFDAMSSSAILDAHEKTHGVRLLPHYRFDLAKTIVSFGADFLGTWISPVEFTADWKTRRIPDRKHPEMSVHVQLEGRMSLTGSNADQRYRLAPDQFGTVLSQLHALLVSESSSKSESESKSESDSEPSPIPEKELHRIVERLQSSKGESLVLCDSQDENVQMLVNAINHHLGNYGKTLDIEHPSQQRQGNDQDVQSLLDDIREGNVGTLLVAGTDFTHNLPLDDELKTALENISLVISFNEREDDFSSQADYVCPDHHPLESWSDAEPRLGVISLSQPTIHPLHETRSLLETLSIWSGKKQTAYEIMREFWEKELFPRAEGDAENKTEKKTSFQEFWDHAVHDGFVKLKTDSLNVKEFQSTSVKPLEEKSKTDGYCLSLYHKVGITDSRHAHNPWLQELPDPITKVTWDNYVTLASKTAEELKVASGDIVEVSVEGRSLELPALVQPGQHDRVIAIALGYGVRGTDRFSRIGPQWLESRLTVEEGETVGRNAALFLEARDGTFHAVRSGVSLTKKEGQRELASTQEHHRLEVPARVAPPGAELREPVQQTTLQCLFPKSWCRQTSCSYSYVTKTTLVRRSSEERTLVGNGSRSECLHWLFGLSDCLSVGEQCACCRQR